MGGVLEVLKEGLNMRYFGYEEKVVCKSCFNWKKVKNRENEAKCYDVILARQRDGKVIFFQYVMVT
jgi:hypothetical protein